MNQQKSNIILFIKILIITIILTILFLEFKPVEDGLPKHSKIININLLNNFNNKSKSEILDIRKEFVANSIFAKENYIPSEEVFGEISDYTHWRSMFACTNAEDKEETTGSSEESRFINNPSILISIDMPSILENNCLNKFSKYRNYPQKAIYVKPMNTLFVLYNKLNFDEYEMYYSLNGLNAKDLGFKYAYVDKKKTSKSISFDRIEKNISTSPMELKDKIELSYDCKNMESCNDGVFPLKEFDFLKKQSKNYSKIYIKLWKEKPKSSKSKADLTEIIFINEKKKNTKAEEYENNSQKEYGYTYKDTELNIYGFKGKRNNIKEIKVNSPVPLSYKTKKEIYKIRKNAVKNSIFSSNNYEPSEEVFGRIQNRKPWVSAQDCIHKNKKVCGIDGPSEEARYINNPALLLAYEFPFPQYKCEDSYKGGIKYTLPEKITYDEEAKEITVKYEALPYCTPNNTFYHLKAINARDLGYKYGYLDVEKSDLNITFENEKNITNTITEFRDYIHVGYSCGHKSGCNNGSPLQKNLTFKYACEGSRQKQILYFKLWKERPISIYDDPDIIEKIIIY